MGRPLNKRMFAKANVGPTAAGEEIKVSFHNGVGVKEGFIVKQKGSKRFVCSALGADDTEHTCTLVAGHLPAGLLDGDMMISFKMDDGETYSVSKIAGRKVTLSAPSATGANAYDGASVQWGFDNYTDQAQVEEAGYDDIDVGIDDDDFTEDA
tara:strand:- start:714 stop:1172 length:459 start_codon:yes stop_codon:yes gene_type:complete